MEIDFKNFEVFLEKLGLTTTEIVNIYNAPQKTKAMVNIAVGLIAVSVVGIMNIYLIIKDAWLPTHGNDILFSFIGGAIGFGIVALVVAAVADMILGEYVRYKHPKYYAVREILNNVIPKIRG